MGNLIGWHSLKATVTDPHKVAVAFYVAGTAASSAKFPVANNVNLALVDLTGTNYRALAVVLDGGAGASSETTTIKLRQFALKTTGSGYCLVVADAGNSKVPDKAIVLETTHLAVNNSGELILVDSGLSVASAEDNAWVSFGDRGVRAVLISGKWYLVVST